MKSFDEIEDLDELLEEAGAGGLSFAAGGEEEAAVRVELPASVEEAAAVLRARDQVLARNDALLSVVEERVAKLGTEEVSPSVAFGLFGRDKKEDGEDEEDEEETRNKWGQMLDRLSAMVSAQTSIETALGGTVVARTRVGWSGDLQTAWQGGMAPETLQLHGHGVRQTLVARAATVRLVALVVSGAAGLVAKLALPLGPLRVLPAAWRFVRDVLQEYRQWRSQQINA